MRLTQNEAICFTLSFSNNQNINSQTKLNKMIARLNLFMIPVDVDFSLNKNGSFSMDFQDIKSNELFEIRSYDFKDRKIPSYYLTEEGKQLANKVINQKLNKILKLKDIENLKTELFRLSNLKSQEISDDEHCKLLVDIDDRFKLVHRINTVTVDLLDLNEKRKNLDVNNFVELTLSALIEYCFNLAKYLKEIRFKDMDNEFYDFDSNMVSYYFLYNLEKIIPNLQEQIESTSKDEVLINKYYQYFVNCAKDTYEFSLENPKLNQLVAK